MARPIKMVVMGASWGGLNAYSRILSSLPEGLPAAIMLVQHQNASADNRLAWLLSRYCRPPVVAPNDKETIRAGHIYVAPPGYHMLVNGDHTVALTVYRPVHFSRPSIDELFFSAGHVYGDQTLGVVLTGANEDGSAGLDYIRRRGGRTLVQSPQSSEAPAMPEAAIALGAAAEVLDLERIGPWLVESLTKNQSEDQAARQVNSGVGLRND